MSDSAVAKIYQWKGHHAVEFCARVLLAVVFIWAAVHKIYDPYTFGLNIATYQILPLELVNLQAIGLPWVEIIVSITLLIGFWTRESALVTIGMNIMFITAITIAKIEGLDIMCGCFASGEAGHQISWDLVIRDIGLGLVGLYIVVIGPRWLTLDRLLAKRGEGKNE